MKVLYICRECALVRGPIPKSRSEKAVKPGLQYTQETGAKPRDFARTQAKKCLQSMRVCLQNFPACVTSQLVAQTTTESDHSFTVEFTTHKCTSTEENKMALACKKEGRIGFSFFRPLLCFCFFSFLFFFFSLIFCRFLLPRKSLKNFDTCKYLDIKIRYEDGKSTKSVKTGLFEEQKSRFHQKKQRKKCKKKEEDEG